ncbi:MAG TPA: antitoxin [Bdellovibrionales bacterium]|nr:antitoxin [Pseudobdellovibrionaceae bacterium]HAG91058.1 antitoxin [Bdellovibrionales bacterium]|tara:strand:- start:728 stop:946 length:219 start_codon:yes stop_codon:yes gene_type:complete
MKKEYDFSKGKRGAYNSRLKKQITIKIDEPTIEYFKKLAEETGVSYQNLINLYLRDCAAQEKKPSIKWLKTS